MKADTSVGTTSCSVQQAATASVERCLNGQQRMTDHWELEEGVTAGETLQKRMSEEMATIGNG